MSKLISFLLISRGRFNELLKSIGSIIDKAKDPSRIEIMLRFDEDDEESISRIDELPKDKIDM